VSRTNGKRKFKGANVPGSEYSSAKVSGNESSRAISLRGVKVSGSEKAMERKGPGAKRPGSESSRERTGHCPGSELAWE